jgi:C1A family cysteine protease
MPLYGNSNLPASVDLSSWTKPVRDQEDVGCCVSFTLCTAARYLYRRYRGEDHLFSPLFLYYVTRKNEGESTKKDGGSTLREGIDAMKKYGVCPEKYWKFSEESIRATPSKKAFKKARKFRLMSFTAVSQTLRSIQSCLAGGFLVLVGLKMHTSFHKKKVVNSGRVPLPRRDEKVLGYHALVIVGYHSDQQTFLVQNSWGSKVGNRGLFDVPYSYVLDPDLCSELYAITEVS